VGSSGDAGRRHSALLRERDELSCMEKVSPAPAEARARISARAHIRSLPPRRQLIVAGASAALAVGSFVRFGFTGHALVGAILAPTLVLLTAIDLDRRLLPDAIVLPTLGVVLILQIALYPHHTLEWVVAALGAALRCSSTPPVWGWATSSWQR
jgi:hypothetical protein